MSLHVKPWKSGVAAALVAGFAILPTHVKAQAPTTSGGASGSSRAVALPPSGRNGTGSVVTQQTPGGSGVSTFSSSVQIGGNYAGSVAASESSTGPIALTLAETVKRALNANLGTVTATNTARASRAGRLQALSALLPSLSASATETVAQVNLAAYGFQFKVPPGLNFSIPSVVGPFTYSQLQGSVSQSVYDPVARRNWKAAKESERADIASARDARELVILAASGAYLQTLAAAERVRSQAAQVENAQAIYNQAVVRKQAGTNSKLDVMRSLVELQTEQQRLTSLESEFQKDKITMARVAGLPLDRELELTEHLSQEQPADLPKEPDALQTAYRGRADIQAARAQVRAAELALSAARAERLPSASINGDYGVLGPNPTSTHGVFNVTGGVNMPIWQGGRVKGDILQAEATLHQRQAELADAQAAVEEQVRTALIDWQTAETQTGVARTNREYAAETLAEARDRFGAGVATTVEVVQAQQQVASAENDYISSLFSLDLARINFARATGQAETNYQQLLTGVRP